MIVYLISESTYAPYKCPECGQESLYYHAEREEMGQPVSKILGTLHCAACGIETIPCRNCGKMLFPECETTYTQCKECGSHTDHETGDEIEVDTLGELAPDGKYYQSF